MTAALAVAAALVLLALVGSGAWSVVRLVGGAMDDAVALPARGRHRSGVRQTRREVRRARTGA